MKKRIYKSSLTIIITIALTVIPSFSDVKPVLLLNQSATAYAASDTIAIDSASAANTNVVSAADATGQLDQAAYADIKTLADKKATTLTSFYNTTSVQYALIVDGKIVISGQIGKKDKATLTKDTVYGIGSISKVFTTTAVMQLVEQGKVKLDSPVVEYIPDFTMADPRYKNITVRMLLNHSSGLMGSTMSNAMLINDNDNSSYTDFLNSLKEARLKADPGEFSVYCNDGFTLAQLLVERVTGLSFADYIKNNISNPLSMPNTKTPQDVFNRNILAKTYLPSFKDALPAESLTMTGAGGIYSTAEDMCRFSEIFMDDSTSNTLSAASRTAMENSEYKNGIWPVEEDASLSYGLGWDNVNTYPFTQYGIKALEKGGDTILYHGSLIVLPEENIAMAVLSSGGSSLHDHIMAQEVLLQTLKAKGTISQIKPNKTFNKPVKATMPDSEKKYEGFYASLAGILKITISDDGVLTAASAFSPKAGSQKLTYTGDGKFYSSTGDSYLSFVEEKNGNTYIYTNGLTLYPSLGQLPDSGYQFQKINSNPIPEKVKKVWEKRDGKKYYLINEKYSSELYLSTPFTKLQLVKEIEGYCLYDAIIDENNAKANFQVPGMYGRDLIDLGFYTLGNAEVMKCGKMLLISEDAIKALPSKSSFEVKINNDGYAQWYKIGKKSANKIVKVKRQDQCSFSVYNKDGACIYNSMISKQTKVTLPVDGTIVFVGAASSNFTVTYSK